MKRKKPVSRKNTMLTNIAREVGSAAGTIVKTSQAFATGAANMVEAGKGKLAEASTQWSAAKKKMTTKKKSTTKKKATAKARKKVAPQKKSTTRKKKLTKASTRSRSGGSK